MRFSAEKSCDCGGVFPFVTYGESQWPVVSCTACGKAAGQINPLSVSVTAERLLYRSMAEMESGDYSLAIVIGTMAVESYLTRLFFKVKGMDYYAKAFAWPTEAQEKAWETEYPRKGGFSGPADFVANATAGMTFDAFIATNPAATQIVAGFPDAAGKSAKQYFQSELFHLRNRIAHWGYVNTTQAEGERCHKLAVAIVSILREMDRLKYGAM
jgi:hypothetical protein